MESQEKKIYNVGVNDLKDTKYERNIVAYKCWHNMLKRCYSGEYNNYEDITVCDEWLLYSRFLKWYEAKHKDKYQLDKDIVLADGNQRIYSPQTCLFVHQKVNLSFRVRNNVTGFNGVKTNGKGYQAQICTGGKLTSLGTFSTPNEAHKEWQKEKIEQIRKLIEEFHDEKDLCAALEVWVKLIKEDIKAGRQTILH